MSLESRSRRLAPIAGGIGAALAVRALARRELQADLTGQVALVTGGSRGLGLAMARELVDAGCRVAICARDKAELERARADLALRGGTVLAIACDVADRADVDRMVAEVRETLGPIDVLIANAGVIQVGQVKSAELEDFEMAMDIMYWGVLYPVLAVLPEMRARESGRIGIVSSIGGKVSVPRLLPYNAAKFAARGLAEGLRAELADAGISVTSIVPGLTRTGSYLNATFSGDEAGREAQYRLFVPLSTLPLLTGSAAAAARAYVGAVRRGDAEIVYPPIFGLVARLHGVAPATSMWAMGVADRLIAQSGDATETVRGSEIDPTIDTGWWRWLTTLGRRAARDLQERPGPVSVPEPD
jgi:NAD(P)-dependent dehydrogenase (short-subunit alcohol dehydrogenase family)